MRLGRSPRRSAGSTRVAMLGILAVVLTACGGGGGGGGGGGAVTLEVLVVNRSRDVEATVMVSDGQEGEPLPVCRARNYTFTNLVEPWQVLVNGDVAIDSANLEPNQVGVSLAGWVEVKADGTIELTELRPGRAFAPPPTLGICT